jgi:hypothetical protein
MEIKCIQKRKEEIKPSLFQMTKSERIDKRPSEINKQLGHG